MLYVIAYLLVSVVIVGIIFYMIERSPAGWEDENGFHLIPEPAPELKKSVSQNSPNIELVFGHGNARYVPHN